MMKISPMAGAALIAALAAPAPALAGMSGWGGHMSGASHGFVGFGHMSRHGGFDGFGHDHGFHRHAFGRDFHFHHHNDFAGNWGWGWGWPWWPDWSSGYDDTGSYAPEAHTAYAPAKSQAPAPPICPEMWHWDAKLGHATREKLCS
jgi:hypothetical protein